MCYRHELWKDYENSEYTGTLLNHGTKISEISYFYFLNGIKSCRFFWVGRLTANNQYLNLGLGWYILYMVLNASFNNISVISLRSVLLVEETGSIPGENH